MPQIHGVSNARAGEVLCCTGATTAVYLSAGNKRIEFVALANLSCANGVLFESVFRAADPQKSFHTAKTLSRTRTALILAATLHAIALTPTADGDPDTTAAVAERVDAKVRSTWIDAVSRVGASS